MYFHRQVLPHNAPNPLPVKMMRRSHHKCETSEVKAARDMIDAKMPLSNTETAYVMSMVQVSMQTRQTMWDFHNHAISTIVPGTTKQQYLIKFTTAFNA